MKTETKAWLILVALSVVWGASFILIKKSMEPIPGEIVFQPFQVGGLRILIAGLVLLPIALKNLKSLNKKNTIYLFLVGLTGNFLPSFLFPLAETEIQSSLAGLLNMGTSVFVILIAWLFFKDKISQKQMIGFALSVFGLSLILVKQIDNEANNFYYALYIILATFFYATSLSLIKYKLQHLKPKVITSLAFFLMLIPAIILSSISQAFSALSFEPIVMTALGYLVILSIIGTALAVLFFNQLVSISSPLFTSSVTYLMPVVALFLGVLDGEDFNAINILWIVIIFVGVFLMSKKSKNVTNNSEQSMS
ncbi:MAG: DMT family transporter [Crocinitomicaceae bacterium]